MGTEPAQPGALGWVRLCRFPAVPGLGTGRPQSPVLLSGRFLLDFAQHQSEFARRLGCRGFRSVYQIQAAVMQR